MGSPFDAPNTMPGSMAEAFSSPSQEPASSEPEPDYTQQSAFDQLPTQEAAPQTLSDPSWNPAPAPAPEPQQAQGRDEDFEPVAAGGGGELPASAQAVARRMNEAGYGPEHIAGVLGVLQQESPGFNTHAVGDSGSSFGIAQWHASRATALMQFARDRNLDPYDADTQAQYLVSELNGPAYRAGQDLQAQTGVAGSARVWRSEFEKPGTVVNGVFQPSSAYDDAAIAAGSRMLPAVQSYVASLRSGQADKQSTQDGTSNGTEDGDGGPSGSGTTLDPVARMEQLRGGNATTAAPFIKAGGGTLDPRKDNWCAAFTNAALGQSGIRGSNSNVATSFLNWGQDVDTSQVQRNDVVCIPRGHGAGELGGHVGLATGGYQDGPNGPEIEMVSGNTEHGHVAVAWVPASEVVVRRSATADTQPQDPQGPSPNVQPTTQRTSSATYSVNGLTLPDLNHGASLPHGVGAPMDPSDAAQFAQANAPSNLTELAKQFGGSFSDLGWGLGRDVLGGNGPIGAAVDTASDWLGNKLGLDLSWLHSTPGQAAPFKGALATVDKAHEALDRAMGYDPNAPTGFMGEVGRNAALVGAVLGPGVLAEGGSALAAGRVGAAAGAAIKGADRAALGGLTISEAQHLTQDITGSPEAGELSTVALAALLGLRVPVIEKVMPSVIGYAKGAAGYARGLVGRDLDDATALNALTPSQLHDAFATGLRDDMTQRVNAASLELANLGNPTSFAGASGDVNANLTRGSDLLAGAIRQSVDNARTVERAMWNNVDKGVMRDYGGANAAYAQEQANFAEQQKLYGRPATDFPSALLSRIFENSSPNRLVSTGVLDAAGQPVMREVSGTGQRGLGLVNNLGSGQEARSQIEEAIRGLQNNPGVPGARSQIGVLQRVSHALLDDMSDLSNGAGDPQAAAAFNKARAFSRALADVRSQPDIAATLDRGIANGQAAVDPAIAASRFLSSGPKGVAGLRQLQKLAQIQTGDPANLNGLFQDFVRQSFMKAAAPDAEHLSLSDANRFMQRYGQVLDQMPEVGAQLQRVISGEQSVAQALGKPRGWQADPAGVDARQAAVNNWLDAPVDTVLRSFDGRPAPEQARMVANVIGQTARDRSGNAFRGFRQALVDRALAGSTEVGSQQALRQWSERNAGILRGMANSPDPGFPQRVAALANVNSRVGALSAVTDLAQRLLGTHLGSLADRAFGGGEGFGGSLSMASWGTKTVRQAWANLPFTNRLAVARELLASPEAFDAFAKTAGTDLRGNAQSLAQQYTAANLLSSYLQAGATPAALALQHAINDWRRQNGDPTAPTPGYVGRVPPPPQQQPQPMRQQLPSPQQPRQPVLIQV